MTDNSSVNFKLVLFQVSALEKICHIPHVIFQTTSQLKEILDKSVSTILDEGL